MTALIDLTGQRFGRLTVVARAENSAEQGRPCWLCRCECGRQLAVRGYCLRRGQQSCGCQKPNNAIHGYYSMPEYKIWLDLCLRCNDPNNKSYKDYGARGLKVEVSFGEFYFDVGPRPPGKTASGKMSLWRIDRIDNERGYVIGNMRWTDHSTSRINQRPREPNKWGKKLTPELAHAIRNDQRSLTTIATAHGVALSTVKRIRNGKLWPHA